MVDPKLLIGEGADDPRFPGEGKLEETKMEQGDNSRDKGPRYGPGS